MSWWSRLYEKRDETNSERSLLGCVVAMILMIVIMALIAIVGRAPWVFGQ